MKIHEKAARAGRRPARARPPGGGGGPRPPGMARGGQFITLNLEWGVVGLHFLWVGGGWGRQWEGGLYE